VLKSRIVEAIGLIIIFYMVFIWINDHGMLGSEEHVVTVQEKKDIISYDADRFYYFTDETGNRFDTDSEIHAKILPGHTYLIKTGKRFPFSGRWYAFYIEELPEELRSDT
jgi:hypothetical protein